MASGHRAAIQAGLRWLASAAALIDRADREAALLSRYEQIPERLKTLESRLECYLAESDRPVEEIQQMEADYDQCLELADGITQKAAEILRVRTGAVRSDGKPAVTHNPGMAAHLPAIHIPVFRGDMDEWTSFIDLFDSLVHARTDLSAALKLAQLMSALVGEPRDLIAHLSVTDENYETARTLLKGRYQNVRRLADALMAKIWAIPRIGRVAHLRVQMLNPVLSATKGLEKLGLPVDKWSYMLLSFLLNRLPDDVRARFEQQFGGDSAQHLPAYTDLVEFLETECRRADTTDLPSTSRPAGAPRPQLRFDPPRGKGAMSGPQSAGPRQYNVTTADPDACLYCRNPGHQVHGCPKFLDQRVLGRRNIVKQRQWCFLCLGKHFVRDCARPQACRWCDGKHHPVLCMNRSGGSTPAPAQGPCSPSARSQHPADQGCMGGEERGSRGNTPSPHPQSYAAIAHAPAPHRGAPTGGCPRSPPPRQAPQMSPPLVERPRLVSGPPGYGRNQTYRVPQAARPTRRQYQPEWDPLDRYERPYQAEQEATRYPC